MKKIYKYGILVITFAFLGYNSVYFKKLSEIQSQDKVEIDYNAYADSLYYKGMFESNHAVELSDLLSAIRSDPEHAFTEFGNRLGIGNSAYFLVKCQGTISAMHSDGFQITMVNGEIIDINTKYIFGNALRDASGLVKLTDFKTNSEFNRVSEALNTLIRTTILPPVLEQLNNGEPVRIIGDMKLNKKELDNPDLEITPSQIIPE